MDEISQLTALLDYMIKHNEEHAEEVKEYAERAKKLGNEEAQADIEKGVALLQQSNEMLRKARNGLK